jgi:hypothetical protein
LREGIEGQFRGVMSGGLESSERFRKRICADGARFIESFVSELNREQRGAGDGGGATLAKKTRFDDAGVFDTGGEMEHIAADWIGHFYAGGGVGYLAHVARDLEVIEDRLTEHEFSIPRVNETGNALSLMAGKAR